MSTTTTNYGLVKPELTDAADITAMNQNWDIIDEELGNIGEVVEESLGNLTPEKIGALPISGGKITGESLFVGNGFGKFYANDFNTGVMHTNGGNDTTNGRGVLIQNANKMPDLAQAFQVYEVSNGVTSEGYKIYGEHNKNLLRNALFTASTTDLEAGTSALESGKLYLVYE